MAVSTVVEASAGTGKTTALVNRIVEAIAAGTPVETIVAVTFTHAAAGNMKLRVRQELERRRAATLDAGVRGLLAGAARSLDRAFIGTIHAFCAQLLRRRPVEAGVDPVFQELAQPEAMRVFDRSIPNLDVEAAGHALACVDASTGAVVVARGASISVAARCVAGGLAWSLAEWRDFDAPWEKRAFGRDTRLASLHCERRQRNRVAGAQRAALSRWAPTAGGTSRRRSASKLHPNLAESELLRLPREVRWGR